LGKLKIIQILRSREPFGVLFYSPEQTVFFVHGCFRHQHEECKKANRPTSNVEFWNTKSDKNLERDKKTVEALTDLQLEGNNGLAM